MGRPEEESPKKKWEEKIQLPWVEGTVQVSFNKRKAITNWSSLKRGRGGGVGWGVGGRILTQNGKDRQKV